MIQTNLLTLPLQDSQSWVPQSIHNFQARLSVLLAEYVEQHSILQACGAKSLVEPADFGSDEIPQTVPAMNQITGHAGATTKIS